MTTSLQVYGDVTRDYIVFDEASGAEVHRAVTVAVPKHLPPARASIYFRIAAFRNAPELLAWLTGRPVYQGEVQVVLSSHYVIHRIGDGGAAFGCGNFDHVDERDRGMPMKLDVALADFIDDKGERHKTRPCRTCFASGLLVAPEEVNP